jgi:DNA primase
MTVSAYKQQMVRLVKDTAQIVDIIGEHVVLKKAGINLKGLCPFHAEKTASFIVNPVRQSFHCFGCGEGGDVFSFMMKYHRLTFPEALQELAGRYHIDLPESTYAAADPAAAGQRQMLFDINRRAAAKYHEFLLQDPAAAHARAYLQQRGIPPQAIEKYQLGYAPDRWDYLLNICARVKIGGDSLEAAGLAVRRDRGGYYDRFRNRVLFPIHDMTGKVVGFGGRVLGEGEPKYLNSPETLIYNKGRILFGLFHHRDAIRRLRRAVIVEGNFDLLSLAVHGVDYGVAPLGTALTNAQLRILKGYADEAILLFDGDTAGLKAALRAVPVFLAEQVPARIALLPAGHDPDTFVAEFGKQPLEAKLDTAQPLSEFVFEQLVEKHGLTLEGKGRILKELQPLVDTLDSDPLQRSVLISRFCDRLQLDVRQVEEAFSATGRQHRPPAATAAASTMDLPRKQKQLLEFIILHPAFLPEFIAGGIEDVLEVPIAKNVLAALREIVEATGDVAPEMLLEVLEEGVERTFVSRLLIGAGRYGGEGEDLQPEAQAAEQLAWLKREQLKKEIAELDDSIQNAAKAGDDELLLALSARKIELNRILSSCRPEDDE